jgi:hypothetical protein
MKRINRVILIALALSALAACATAPKSLTYGPQDPEGLVIYQYDDFSRQIVKVDLNAGVAGPKKYTLGNRNGLGAVDLTGEYGIQKLPPGDYAIVRRINILGVVRDLCYETQAPVFRVEAGSIIVLEEFDRFRLRAILGSRVNGLPRPKIAEKVAVVLQDFPLLTAQPKMADTSGFVGFSERELPQITGMSCGSGSKVRPVNP